VNLIFNRLKHYHGLTSDGELAKLLGLNQSTLSMQKSRGSIDLHAVLSVSEGIDLNWLFKSQDRIHSTDEDHPSGTSDTVNYFQVDENQLMEEILKLRRRISDLEAKLEKS